MEGGQTSKVCNQHREAGVAQKTTECQMNDWSVLVSPHALQSKSTTKDCFLVSNMFKVCPNLNTLPFRVQSIHFGGNWPLHLKVEGGEKDYIRRCFEQHLTDASFLVHVDPCGGSCQVQENLGANGDPELYSPQPSGNSTDFSWRLNTGPMDNN